MQRRNTARRSATHAAQASIVKAHLEALHHCQVGVVPQNHRGTIAVLIHGFLVVLAQSIPPTTLIHGLQRLPLLVAEVMAREQLPGVWAPSQACDWILHKIARDFLT